MMSLLSKTFVVLRAPSIFHPSINNLRYASQLYPTTSQRWDEAMNAAESLIGEKSLSVSSLQKIISGEFVSITRYLEKLVGTNHPMLETAKRCAYISEGRMGSAQARGLTVLLVAKTIEDIVKPNSIRSTQQIVEDQLSLAEMTEITYSAYMIHRGIMDLATFETEQQVINESLAGDEKTNTFNQDEVDKQLLVDTITGSKRELKGLHYGNKVSALCGDFLLAHVMRGLGDLYNSKAVDLTASAITEFINGEFLLLDDWKSQNFLRTEKSRDFNRWLLRSYSSIGVLQGNSCQAALVIANIDESLQERAFEFGKNLGLAWQAHTEVQPFLSGQYEPIELDEMPAFPSFDLNCLPVLFFLRHSYNNFSNFNLMIEKILKSDSNRRIGDSVARRGWKLNFDQHHHEDIVDYAVLHKLIRQQGYAIEASCKTIEEYRLKAQEQLEFFPKNKSRDTLFNLCESLSIKF